MINVDSENKIDIKVMVKFYKLDSIVSSSVLKHIFITIKLDGNH